MRENRKITVYIPNAGAPSGVEKNRTTFPAQVNIRTDVDLKFDLEEFTTNPIRIPHADTMELSYDKRNSVLRQDKSALINKASESILFNWLPDNAHTIETTGKSVTAHSPSGGTIYKAANFKYFGKHQTIFLRNKRTNDITHQQNLTNTTCRPIYLRENTAFLLGDFEVFKVDTYRYIFPLCRYFRFKTKELPYPPYNKGIIPFEWKRDKPLIKERLIKIIREL